MFRYSFVVLCAVLVLSNLAFTNAGKFGGGGGRSGGSGSRGGGRGGGAVHYPPSSGYSGTGSGRGGSVHYPPSSGYSGTGSGRGGGVHYPPSNGASGTGSGRGGGAHYPPSNGASGTGSGHGGVHYPPSPGSSGNNNYPGGRVNAGSTTTHVHHHYHYSPPQQISYGARSYPVYRGSPPTYVYQYKNSGSKYGTLLAGLALFNLGALAGVAGSQIHSHQKYQYKKGEICLFGVRKDNGDYEETKIDCSLITSFIHQYEAEAAKTPTNTANHTVTSSTTNITVVNTTNTAPDAPQVGASNITYTMLPNGTLVPVNVTTNVTTDTPAGGSSSVVYTTTTTNTTTVVDALEAKGPPVQVTPGMTCYVIRKIENTSLMKKTVPCGVLQSYSDKSLKRNSAVRTVPAVTILAVMCTAFLVY